MCFGMSSLAASCGKLEGAGVGPWERRGPSQTRKDHRNGEKGLAVGLWDEDEEAAGARAPLPVVPGRSQATRSSAVLESTASSAAS